MTKLLLILVAAILALILPAGVIVAKTAVKQIEFNLDDGTYEIQGTVPVSVSASVVLTGNLREKGTNIYLSPLNGTIKIGGEEHNILVKAEKQSEPVIHIHWTNPHDGWVHDVDLQHVLVNVEGWKATSGTVQWVTKSKVGEPTEFFSKLYFWGTVDGELVDCEISGPFPIIN